MISLELSTPGERRLYVDAMFYCLSRGMVSDHAACGDLLRTALRLSAVVFAPAEETALTRHIAETVQRFRLGATNAVSSRDTMFDLLEAAAKGQVGDLRAFGVLADA